MNPVIFKISQQTDRSQFEQACKKKGEKREGGLQMKEKMDISHGIANPNYDDVTPSHWRRCCVEMLLIVGTVDYLERVKSEEET